MRKAAIFTLDTALYTQKNDSTASLAIQTTLRQAGYDVRGGALPEDKELVKTVITRLTDSSSVQLIITVGDTGITEKDIAPEIVEELSDRMLPGIPETIRSYMTRYSKKVLFDRAAAGIRKQTILLNLSDDVKDAKESLEFILPELMQAVEVLNP